MCLLLGRACASTANIFAMHQTQVMCIVRHGVTAPFFREYLAEIARKQSLIGSATSEDGPGGNMRASSAAVTKVGERVQLHKRCPAISYCDAADALLVTARRAPDAKQGDQVLVLLRKEQCTLAFGKEWDALGMRGTCTPAVELRGEAPADHVLPDPFGLIASMTMVPCSHIFWSSSWLGVADDAVAIARRVLAAQASGNPESSPLGARRLAEAGNSLHRLRACVRQAVQEFERLAAAPENEDAFFDPSFAIDANDLKIAASELMVTICMNCLDAIGLRGYANNSEHSLGRHVRDALGAKLMIGNERIWATNAKSLLMSGGA